MDDADSIPAANEVKDRLMATSKPHSLKTLADYLGLSPATVSVVLNESAPLLGAAYEALAVVRS